MDWVSGKLRRNTVSVGVGSEKGLTGVRLNSVGDEVECKASVGGEDEDDAENCESVDLGESDGDDRDGEGDEVDDKKEGVFNDGGKFDVSNEAVTFSSAF
jgi:hypothetical protein